MAERPRQLHRDGGGTIAYHNTPGKSPGVVFLSGYRSDMTGAKAMALEAACREQGRAFVRFDYSGHGASGGRFDDLGLSDWIGDALAVLDSCTEAPQVLVGSSMGGWIMVHTALARPGRVAGLVGIAAAPDFTEDLLWDTASTVDRETLLRDGAWREPGNDGDGEWIVTRHLIEDGRRHLVLRGPIAINIPVRLLHGTDDETVPPQTSQRLADALDSEDTRLTLIEGGGHRLSEPEELAAVIRAVDGLCDQLEGDGASESASEARASSPLR